MMKINYNLASTRKIDIRAFAMAVTVILLAAAAFNTVTFFNLQSLQRQSRAEKREIRFAALRLEELQQKTLQQQREIDLWKKAWETKLAFANFLIERKCFSFIFRLNFLERICNASLRIRQLSISNDPAGPVQMTVDARAQNELLRLYKKLLRYDLVIGNENQIAESYQANLSFNIKNEKK